MGYFRRHFLATPWHLIRLFIPLTALAPFAVYTHTLFPRVYPGTTAFLTAASAGLCETNDLMNPLFRLVARCVADLPYGTLTGRLNLLCAVCGAFAVALFYLFAARLVFVFAFEDPGGAMAALPPRLRETDDDSRSKEDASFALNPDGSVSIPPSVLAHNWRVAYAAVFGGLAAATVLAFCAPFWLAATRLYPYTFDLALLFLILNLLLSYDQQERLLSLFSCTFLMAVCMLESPLFMVLLPVGGLFLLRSLRLNEQATTYRVLGMLLVGLAGAIVAVSVLWDASRYCSAVAIPSPRTILRAYQASFMQELLAWIPASGWSLIFVQLLLPCAIALFVFHFAFVRRVFSVFALEVGIAVCLVPSLLNLRFSPWGIARLTSKVPVLSYTILALFTGLLVAAWYLMRELFQDKVDEDLDYYEYRDNPLVCRLGAFLCWPLLALALLVPFRSFQDIDPRVGTFADEVAETLYRDLDGRDWLVNSDILNHHLSRFSSRQRLATDSRIEHHLILRAHSDGRRLRLITTDAQSKAYDAAELTQHIMTDPAFALNRYRLVNAADISPASFLREWFLSQTNAYSRAVLFRTPELLRDNGFAALPCGFFLRGAPDPTPPDALAALAEHRAFVQSMKPYLSSAIPDTIPLFADYRLALRLQLGFIGNELAFLLASQNRLSEAAELLQETEALAPDSLSLLLNRFHLATALNSGPDTLSLLVERLRSIPLRLNTYALTRTGIESRSGSLINPDVLDLVRKTYWRKGTSFRALGISAHSTRDPLTLLVNRKGDLYQAVSRSIDAADYDEADRQLNLLLDLDQKDPNVFINKAMIAIERRNLPEAGLWMDLAKENGAPPEKLVWNEAALLILQDDLPAARARLNEAIPAATSDVRLWGLLAEILIRSGEYDELENRVYPAMRGATSRKDHYLLHLVRGRLCQHNGPQEYAAARSAFLRALALNPNLTSVREDLLRLDDALGIPAFSEQDAKAVLLRDPNHAFANYLLGSVRLHRGELEKAEDLFSRSLEHAPSAQAYAGLGAVLFAKGKLDQAEALTRQALGLDASLTRAQHTLAKILLATERTDEAASALAPVLTALPEDLNVRITLIRLRIAQQRIEEAALLASQLLENDDLLPPAIARQLKPLADELTERLSPPNP